MTSSARSPTDLALAILHARDDRQQALEKSLRGGGRATVFVSLNVPGRDKTPPGARAFFAFIVDKLVLACGDPARFISGEDALGPYAIVAFDLEPLAAKQHCVAIEASDPSARLADLDVYDGDGEQLGRARLGLPPRSCLVCAQPAVDCMRVKRHPRNEITALAHALLARVSA